MSILNKFLKKSPEKSAKKAKEKTNKIIKAEKAGYDDEEQNDELTAVIAAAIACAEEEEEIIAAIISAIYMFEKQSDKLIIKNIKRTASIESIWAHEGRMKLMR